MSEFGTFKKEFTAHVNRMMGQGVQNKMFQVAVEPETIWTTYLESFAPGTNEIYRERAEHDCTNCRHFLRQYGNVVVLVSKSPVGQNTLEYEMVSAWDFEPSNVIYKPVVKALRKLIHGATIGDVLVVHDKLLGVDVTRSLNKVTNDIETWQHLSIELQPGYLHGRSADTNDSIRGKYKTNAQCVLRLITEIKASAVTEVLELIAQNSLVRGEQYGDSMRALRIILDRIPTLSPEKRTLLSWKIASEGSFMATLRNTSLGTLLVNLSEGMDVELALRKYEEITAGPNYRRPTATMTPRMLEAIRKELDEAQLLDSLPHKFAVLSDISINDVLFADRSVREKMRGNVFDEISRALPVNPRTFDRIEEVSWDKFVKDILPGTTGMDVLFEPELRSNLVSLLAPVNAEAQPLFSWPNNFCWAYKGNMADSMKERVKAAGGRVDGVLRYSIQWNEDDDNNDDLDAHALTPQGAHISFRQCIDYASRGNLDVDIQYPSHNTAAVENITWPALDHMPDGVYTFFTHVWAHRTGQNGFRAEIEANGTLHSFSYSGGLRSDMRIYVATVTKSGNTFTVTPAKGITVGAAAAGEAWKLTTGTFVPVQAIMYSPNYWGSNATGHRHVMLMLQGCISDETPNGFFNEYLKPELNKFRKGLEYLGSKMAVEPCSDQLSGLGFSTTKRGVVTLKLRGGIERVIKVTF